jgi:opacity protein-like surface antigen
LSKSFCEEISKEPVLNNAWYLGLMGGVSFKNSSTTSTFYKSFDAGPITGIFGGYDFSYGKIELQVSQRENPVNHEYASISTAKTAEESAVTFFANGYYFPFHFQLIRPYAGVGLGYAIHSYAWHRHNHLSKGEFVNFNHIRKYSNGFTYQVVAGFEFKLHTSVRLSLEYDFWAMPWIHYGGFEHFDKVSTSFSSNLLLIKLTYKFP